MPMHDWKRVEAGIFHAFHHEWISEISRALNRGLLPDDMYALPEGDRSSRLTSYRGCCRGGRRPACWNRRSWPNWCGERPRPCWSTPDPISLLT